MLCGTEAEAAVSARAVADGRGGRGRSWWAASSVRAGSIESSEVGELGTKPG